MKIAFYTLGCKANQFETQALERLFQQRGHQLVPFDGFADIYIVNTCTVTALSDKKSRNAARRCRRLNPNCRLILCGCYAQLKPEEAKALCDADAVVGTADKSRIVDIAEGLAPDGVTPLWQGPRPGFDLLPAGGLSGRTRALLKVQDGCQNFCTYCRIPYARGPIRSLPLEEAKAQAAQLAAQGYRELVLTGIEISSWGREWRDGSSLIDLIEAVCHAVPEMRVRLGSLEPRTVTENFCARLAALPNLCPHFHLSLQSGSDTVLARMRRRYTSGEFLNACAMLREAFEDCALTTDVMTGFPGETEGDFEETLDVVRQVGFTSAYTFIYSKRSGTPAAKMENQVPLAVKKERLNRLMALQNENSLKCHEKLVGQTVEVLAEGPSKQKTVWNGRTRTGVLVLWPIEDKQYEVGQKVNVQIEAAQTWLVKGKAVD